MRILHIDTERTWRGGEQQIAYLVAGLAARGHRSVLAAPPDSEIRRRFDGSGHEVIPVEMRGELDLRGVVALIETIRRLRPDVVHMHTAHAHTLGLAAARLAGRARRVVSRRVDFPIGRASALVKYRFGVDRYIAITEAVAGVLREAGVAAGRITVVPSGIDPVRLEGADRARGRRALGVDDAMTIVGTVAHFAWHKGLVHLVRAWREVASSRFDTVLVLVGHGEDEGMLRAAAHATGAAASIRFAGFRTDVPDCLAAMDCFVLPSVLEGLGTSLLDALALGVPVVASRTGGIPEVVTHEETGLLVAPRDEPALARAILRILDDRALAVRTARAGRARVLGRFTADTMVEGTLAAYEAITR